MKRGTPRHPKTSALAVKLKIPLPHAVGLLEMLWHFTSEFCPQGNIGRYSDEEISEAICWEGRPSRLITALLSVGWLDKCARNRLVIHDWSQHADQSVKRRVERNGLAFSVASQKLDMASSPEPKPVPVPKPQPPPDGVRSNNIDGFEDFRGAWQKAGAWQVGEEDWKHAHRAWGVLDGEAKMAAVRGLELRAGTDDPALISLPKNYLQGKVWTRAVRARAPTARAKSQAYLDSLCEGGEP